MMGYAIDFYRWMCLDTVPWTVVVTLVWIKVLSLDRYPNGIGLLIQVMFLLMCIGRWFLFR